MHVQSSGVNGSSMGFLKEAGEFFTGISNKIKLVWEECLPALKQIASTTASFIKAHKKEVLYATAGLLATATLIGLVIVVKKTFDHYTKIV